MADLSLRERLQPSLLDRLLDDERLLTLFEASTTRGELSRLGISESDLTHILTAQGLRPADPDSPGPARSANGDSTRSADVDSLTWRFSAPTGRVSLAQLKALVLKPPGAPQGASLQSFCRIEARNILNESVESAERRQVAARRLREYVYRDLASLLNAISLDGSDDLTRYPHVRDSVVNFGMPSLAGVAAIAVDAQKTAAAIEAAIARFEPRLRRVRVTPEGGGDRADGSALSFRIEAELWGQPAPQQLILRTRIDTDSGHVTLADAGAS